MDSNAVRFFIFSTSQTNHFQPEFLVRDTAGVEFGNSIEIREQMVVQTIYTICSCTVFFAFLVVQ